MDGWMDGGEGGGHVSHGQFRLEVELSTCEVFLFTSDFKLNSEPPVFPPQALSVSAEASVSGRMGLWGRGGGGSPAGVPGRVRCSGVLVSDLLPW